MKNISRNFTKKGRGQLNIIEVVLAASIILVLSVSIAQVGIKIAESNNQAQTSILTSLPANVLRDSDNLGFLRPFIYLNNDVNLIVYLDESLPIGTFYWLYELNGNCLKNSQLDCSDLNLVTIETYSSTLYLSGYLTNNSATIAILTLSTSL
jgi:hypothetical protein